MCSYVAALTPDMMTDVQSDTSPDGEMPPVPSVYRLYFDPRSAPVVFRQPQFARNQYKIALLGASRVGKTALFNRLCYDTFHMPDPSGMSMSVADECMVHSRIGDKQSCEWAETSTRKLGWP